MVYVLDCVVLVWYVCCMTNIRVNPAAAALRGLLSVPPERRLLFRLRCSASMSSPHVALFNARRGSLVVADERECGVCALSRWRLCAGLPRVP